MDILSECLPFRKMLEYPVLSCFMHMLRKASFLKEFFSNSFSKTRKLKCLVGMLPASFLYLSDRHVLVYLTKENTFYQNVVNCRS